MAWLELSLVVPLEDQSRVEAALDEVGALSVTLRDADADTPDERAIFEPGVGETPLWSSIVLDALFDADIDREGLLHVLSDLVPGIDPAGLIFREVADQDWIRAWMADFRPMRFGRRLWVYPWNIDPPTDDEAVVVRLDPGLAFGTGTHPTTALCLEWLDAIDLRHRRVIDFGCGSGILALAALKLGAASVIGIDNDPQAISASRDNAERNGVGERLQLVPADRFQPIQVDVLVANILAGPLLDLAGQLAACVRPGGLLALSGLLATQADGLVAHYATWFESIDVEQREDWVRISARRKD